MTAGLWVPVVGLKGLKRLSRLSPEPKGHPILSRPPRLGILSALVGLSGQYFPVFPPLAYGDLITCAFFLRGGTPVLPNFLIPRFGTRRMLLTKRVFRAGFTPAVFRRGLETQNFIKNTAFPRSPAQGCFFTSTLNNGERSRPCHVPRSYVVV